MICRQVTDDPHSASVYILSQPDQCLVTTQQRIDLGETRSVVTMIRPPGKYRRQVQHVRAQLDKVVQMLADAVEVAAE